MSNIISHLPAAALLAISWLAATTFAQTQDSTVLVPKAAGTAVQPTSPAPGQPTTQPRQPLVIDESVPGRPGELPSPKDAVRRPTAIKYDTDSDARRMYACTGSVELIMVTCNPANGCYYEIPMCIPGCCTGEPSVVHRR
ncbi:MAG: hypothetical protein WD669_10835 [Pirellulales bacterium]